MGMTRQECAALDEADGLADIRHRFALPEGVIYLDGNSLGPMPRHVPARIRHVVETEWSDGLVRSWNDAGWIEAPRRVSARIARLIGATEDEVAGRRFDVGQSVQVARGRRPASSGSQRAAVREGMTFQPTVTSSKAQRRCSASTPFAPGPIPTR
jgi:kynureninase